MKSYGRRKTSIWLRYLINDDYIRTIFAARIAFCVVLCATVCGVADIDVVAVSRGP